MSEALDRYKEYMESIQGILNDWKKEVVQEIADPRPGSTAEDEAHWIGLLEAIKGLKQHIDSSVYTAERLQRDEERMSRTP
jgi:hypothetical protein